MGSCASSGGRTIAYGVQQSKMIYNKFLQQGLNSGIQGVRTKAEQGTGNYSFKNASAAPFEEAITMSAIGNPITRGEYTLIEGYTKNGKHIYYAGKTDSKEIQKLIEKRKNKTDTTPNIPDTIRTTSTYDRWLKNNGRKFDRYYNGS